MFTSFFKVNSIFHMKRPDDLVAFLQQEKRVEELEHLKEILVDTSSLDKVVEAHEPDLESRFYDQDGDCQKAGQPLTEFDLFVSTLIQPDEHLMPQVSKLLKIDESQKRREFYQQPDCSRSKPRFFELDIIDQLSSTLRKDVLNMPPEVGLLSNVLEYNKLNLAQYGHFIYEALQNEDEDTWLANLLGSNFWRILGKPQEAIECLRRSIYLAPIGYKHLALLSLANVFHRTHNSQDAVTTLELALKYNPNNPALHFTLGNVYATLMQFNNSAASYSDAIRLQPSFEAAKSRKHAVLCHHKLEQALEEQHRSLEATLNELRQYKKQHDEWSTLLNKILSEQASLETRMESRMEYEELKMRQSQNGQGQNCYQHSNQNGKTMVTCSLMTDQDLYNDLWTHPASSSSSNDKASKKVDTLINKFKHIENNDEAPLEEHDVPEPTLPVKYANWPDTRPALPFEDSEWPSPMQCAGQVSKEPQWNEYPTVFMSPEDKGYDVAQLMSKSIGIPLEYPAPLPWLPPSCKPFTGKSIYDKAFQAKIKKAEREIEASYYVHSVEKNYHEWGARVHSALDKRVSPQWIVYVLAGTYWRIFGQPQNGLDCFKWALKVVPSQYEDLVLTNLAGLLYKSGALDDALELMTKAYQQNNKDPNVNFFLGNLYSAKSNFTGALFHYKQALRMKPDFQAALQFILVPACQLKFKSQETKDKIAVMENNEDLILCKDGHCKTVSREQFMAQAMENGGQYVMSEDGKNTWIQAPSSSSSSKKRKSKKKKSKKSKKLLAPEPGEDTILVDPEKMKSSALPIGAVEIGTIAESESEEDDEEEDTLTNHDEELADDNELELLSEANLNSNKQRLEEGFIGPFHLVDDALPDVMIKVHEKFSTVHQPNEEECKNAKEINWSSFTSTWLSVSAKNIDIREFLGDYLSPIDTSKKLLPYCDEVPTSLLAMDHLAGVRSRHQLHLASEAGLKEAFQGMIGEKRSVEEMAARITLEMQSNATSWVLSTAAALYWRVKGRPQEAVQCLRHSLYHAPRNMKDIPLVSLANIMHRAGLYNDALIAANMALEISPKFVVTHFTMANIYVSKVLPILF